MPSGSCYIRAHSGALFARAVIIDGRLAQLVEQLTLNQRVVGSSPTSPTTIRQKFESVIESGLIAVLERVYSGQNASEILAFDVEDFFRQLGLDKYLTSGRRNGAPV